MKISRVVCGVLLGCVSVLVSLESFAADFSTLSVVRSYIHTHGSEAFKDKTIYDAMTDAQKAELHAGRQVIVTENTAGAWPKTEVYQLVNETPERSFGLFSDYAKQKDYVHTAHGHVVKSTSTPTADPSICFVEYKIDLPGAIKALLYVTGFSSEYKVRSEISQSSPDTYTMNWKLSQATSFSKVEGTAWFQAMPGGSGNTLMAYSNWLNPLSTSSVLKNSTIVDSVERAAHESVDSIVKHIEASKSNSHLIDSSVEQLRTILAQKRK